MIKHPDLPFAIKNGALLYDTGIKEPASPEVQVMALILLELQKLNAPKTETPPEPTKKPNVPPTKP